MAKKQISDLSVAELSDLNLSCKFIMDDSNKKTKQISFGIVESKLSSEIQKTVENSLLEKLSSSVINSGGTANFLDYGATLQHLLRKNEFEDEFNFKILLTRKHYQILI